MAGAAGACSSARHLWAATGAIPASHFHASQRKGARAAFAAALPRGANSSLSFFIYSFIFFSFKFLFVNDKINEYIYIYIYIYMCVYTSMNWMDWRCEANGDGSLIVEWWHRKIRAVKAVALRLIKEASSAFSRLLLCWVISNYLLMYPRPLCLLSKPNFDSRLHGHSFPRD